MEGEGVAVGVVEGLDAGEVGFGFCGAEGGEEEGDAEEEGVEGVAGGWEAFVLVGKAAVEEVEG